MAEYEFGFRARKHPSIRAYPVLTVTVEAVDFEKAILKFRREHPIQAWEIVVAGLVTHETDEQESRRLWGD